MAFQTIYYMITNARLYRKLLFMGSVTFFGSGIQCPVGGQVRQRSTTHDNVLKIDQSGKSSPPSDNLQELLKRAREKSCDYNAMEALLNFDLQPSQGVPIYSFLIERFLKSVHNSSEDQQVYAWVAIRAVGKLKAYQGKAISSVPILLRLMETDQKWSLLHGDSLDAVIEIAPEDSRLQLFLLENLQNGCLDQIIKTANYLSKQGAKANFAVPTLLQMVTSSHGEDEACYAYQTLGAITKARFAFSTDNAISRLSQLSHLSPEEGSAIFATLIDAGTSATDSTGVLLNVLKGQYPMYIRYASLLALQASGRVADPNVLKDLLRQSCSSDEDHTLIERSASEIIIKSVTSKKLQALPVLTSSLRSSEYAERHLAALALINLGESGKSAVPAIIDSMKEEMKCGDYSGLNVYVTALSILGQPSPDFSNRIFEMMGPKSALLSQNYNSNDFRPEWFSLLAVAGLPKEKSKLQFLVSQVVLSLKGADDEGFGEAAKIAGQMKEYSAELVEPLTLLLKSAERAGGLNNSRGSQHQGHTRHTWNWQNPDTIANFKEVVRSLGNFGSNARYSVPILERYSKMPSDAPLAEAKVDANFALKQIAMQVSKTDRVLSAVSLKQKLAAVRLTDIRGKAIDIEKGNIHSLFFFADITCPCVQAYVERLRILQSKYKRNIRLIVVFPGGEESESMIRVFVNSKKIPGLIVQDKNQQITKLLGAQRTAQVILLSGDGMIQYSGRIDDNIYEIKLVKDKSLDKALILALINKKYIKAGILPLSCELVY